MGVLMARLLFLKAGQPDTDRFAEGCKSPADGRDPTRRQTDSRDLTPQRLRLMQKLKGSLP